VDRWRHFSAYYAKRLEFEIMPGEADKTFKHNGIRIKATDHGVTQLTGFEDSDFHDIYLISGAGNISPAGIRQQYSPDKLVNVIIFYRLYEIPCNHAIGDATAFVIKYLTHRPRKPVYETKGFRNFTAVNDRKIG